MMNERPRADLPFTCSRRHFFKALLHEMVVTVRTVQGGQSFRLAELGSLPDDQLACLIPTMNPAYEIYPEEGYLWAREKKSGKTSQEFPLSEANRCTFNLFNGRNTLGEVGRQLSQELGWEEARAFAQARELFLFLVEHLVCLPSNPRVQDSQ